MNRKQLSDLLVANIPATKV